MAQDNGNGPISADDPQVRALIEKAIQSELGGLIKNRDELFEEKERLTEQVKSLGGDEGIQALVELRRRIEADEETRLMAEGKLEEVLDRRMAPERQKAVETNERLKASEARAGEYRQRFHDTLLDSRLAGMSGLQDGALPLVQKLGRDFFTVDDSGQVVPRDGAAQWEEQPVTPDTFQAYLVQKHPYLFRSSEGGVASPGAGGAPPTHRMRRSDFEKLSSPQRTKFMRGGGELVD